MFAMFKRQVKGHPRSVLDQPHRARNPKTILSENGSIGKIVLSARGLKEGYLAGILTLRKRKNPPQNL